MSTEQYGIDSTEKFGKTKGDETLCKTREEETLCKVRVVGPPKVSLPRSAYLQKGIISGSTEKV